MSWSLPRASVAFVLLCLITKGTFFATQKGGMLEEKSAVSVLKTQKERQGLTLPLFAGLLFLPRRITARQPHRAQRQ
jgi:hypothetical protein